MTDNIVKLPCGIGDTIYNINFITNEIREHTVISITFLLSKTVNHLAVNAVNYRGAAMTFEMVDYNRTWFTDRTAAEKRLAELKGEKDE